MIIHISQDLVENMTITAVASEDQKIQ